MPVWGDRWFPVADGYQNSPVCFGGGWEGGAVSILQGAGKKRQHGSEPVTPRRKFASLSVTLAPSERHGFPGVATRLLSVAPDKAPHRKVSPKLSISLTNNSANFSLPSGFTHRACIPECPRRFQNFLRVPECLYTPTNQASILLQGAHRLRLSHLQVLPPA